ncbi:transcriptional regulator, TetR family [Actinomyces johnsonii F0542]|uniref:Transcriptional regulator, TetR family n=1 Tax=Actinomyces johnsonii F0542 TaxID=1321818 RepID=U1S258_9ACTO|nr:TetR/AcrR family transcriptional regulator [Actinomyces johnsonii]ERH24742.1 transcriptional regulator, TetR family [Actinomyces johnsonii F0542]
MPRSTFFNLPEDKRARVVKALKAEFAARPYVRASVDRVIGAAGVSKGSFYQYFDNKEDAYAHLVRELVSASVDLAGAAVSEAPFEEVLAGIVRGSRDFHLRDPLGWAVLARTLADDAPPMLESDQSVSGSVHRWAVAAIAAGQTSGELREDIDAETAAWMIERVLLGTPHYVMSRFNVDPERVAADSSAFDRPEIDRVADDVVALLVSALKAPCVREDRNGGYGGEDRA